MKIEESKLKIEPRILWELLDPIASHTSHSTISGVLDQLSAAVSTGSTKLVRFRVRDGSIDRRRHTTVARHDDVSPSTATETRCVSTCSSIRLNCPINELINCEDVSRVQKKPKKYKARGPWTEILIPSPQY